MNSYRYRELNRCTGRTGRGGVRAHAPGAGSQVSLPSIAVNSARIGGFTGGMKVSTK
jgi:hypothetical protein